MKILLFTIFLILYHTGFTQTKTVFYTPSPSKIFNPERAFFKFYNSNYDTKYPGYVSLDQNQLINWRLTNNISLIYKGFYLESFVNSPISESYLAKMQSDFDKIRNAGLKIIVRFAYSNDDYATTKLPKDASKTIILSHIEQLKPLLQKNADIIYVVKAGFIGTWGEWYYTDQKEFGIRPELPNHVTRKEVTDALLNALPTNRMIQLRTPDYKRNMYSLNAITDNQAFNNSSVARIGHHNDCFLADENDFGTYANKSKEYPYLENETKFLPMGGETCFLNPKNLSRSSCSTALLELEKFHWSFLNIDYQTAVLDEWKKGTNPCYDQIENRLGYRFQLNSGTFPEQVGLGGSLSINLKIENKGFAAPFNPRKAYLILKNTSKMVALELKSDPRKWLGKDEITIEDNLPLPKDLPTGKYDLFLHLPDAAPTLANRPEYAIRLANEGLWENSTGLNKLNHSIVVNALPLGIPSSESSKLLVFPVPATSVLILKLEGIDKYNISIISPEGKIIIPKSFIFKDKVTLDVKNLASGIYILKLHNNVNTISSKILIEH